MQLALARKLAERGKQRLAKKQPAEALAELRKSRAIFTGLRAEPQWKVLTPVEMKTENGSKLELQKDGSVFVHQPTKNDTYALVFQTELKGIKGLRLEALADSRLPAGGPGWAPAGAYAGNFVLSELSLQAASAKSPDQARPIALRNASADFSEEGWDVRGAVVGNVSRGWAVHPEYNKDHVAVFDTAEEVGDGQATRLTVRLNHQYTLDKHLLGRFRLSFTNDAATLQATRIRLDLKDSEVVDTNVALAKAYHLLGNQAALDSLLKAHPAAGAGIGDLYAADKSWQRAVAEYTKAIARDAMDAKLLAKRAEAYEKLMKWDLAVADWTRASQQQHDVAFERFKPAGAKSWQIGLQNGGAGSMEVVDGTLVFTTTVASGTSWHVQAVQAPLRLENGVEYVIRFKMKSPDSCSVGLVAGINESDWHLIGLNETVVPPYEFKDYEFTFVPHDVVPGNNAMKFDLGISRGKVLVKEIVILKKTDAATLQATRVRLIALAKAHAQQGHINEAVASITEALDLTADRAGKARIIAEAAPLPGVLDKLAERSASNAKLQTELARHYAERGKTTLANAARAKARALFEGKLAKEPDNTALAAELADLLLIDTTRWTVPKLTDPWLKLGAAYEVNGHNDRAVRYAGKALEAADGYEAKKVIFAQVVNLDTILGSLVKRYPGEAQLQLALARNRAARGKTALAAKKPAAALAALKQAQDIFTRLLAPRQAWTVLTPVEMKSKGGATLTKLDDGSILAGGVNPDQDTYTFVAQTDLPKITAFRLEAMAHESLAKGGPGRCPWGNFALSEISLKAEPLSGAGEAATVKLVNPQADFEQDGYPVAGSLDGNSGTAWSIDPKVGQNHAAVFGIESSRQTGFKGGTKLTFTLDFQFNVKHAIGRFRLSVTNDDAATLQATRIRLDLKDSEIVDLSVALAKAHAQQGQSDQAVAAFARALALAKDSAGKARIITEAAALPGVLEKLAKRAAGNAQLQAELARHFAEVAYGHKKFAAATRFWAEALASDPKLGDDRQAQHRYNAARAAALAAAGQAKDEPPQGDAAKAKLRRQALDWLKAELTAWSKLLDSAPPENIVPSLSRWRKDADLAGIRDAAALAKLPADERKEWQALWAEVASALRFRLPKTGPTSWMAQDREGKLLAVPNADVVAIFDARTGELVQTLTGHTDRVYAIAFSPDGKLLAGGNCWGAGKVNTVRVWDLKTGMVTKTLASVAHLQGIKFSGDGKRLFGSGPGGVQMWDIPRGRLARTFKTGQDKAINRGGNGVFHIGLSPDGKRLVCHDTPTTAKVWDVEGDSSPVTLGGFSIDPTYVAYSPDGKLLATGNDAELLLWDASTLKLVKKITTPAAWLAFAPDGKSLLTAQHDPPRSLNDDMVIRWDLATYKGKPLPPLTGRTGWPVYHLSPDGKTLYTLVVDGQDKERCVRVYDLLALSKRFSAIIQGKQKPADNAERLRVAQIAYDQKQFAGATRLWAEALASDPKLGDDRQKQHRYHAARAAALVAAGQGKDEPPLDDAAKAKLRGQALDWLKAELSVWTKQLTSGPPQARPIFVQTLMRNWQKDSDLAGIRDKAALAKIPAQQQKAFTQLWADVAALLKNAEEKPK